VSSDCVPPVGDGLFADRSLGGTHPLLPLTRALGVWSAWRSISRRVGNSTLRLEETQGELAQGRWRASAPTVAQYWARAGSSETMRP